MFIFLSCFYVWELRFCLFFWLRGIRRFKTPVCHDTSLRLYSSFAKVIKISEFGIYIDFSVFFFKQERHVNSPEDLEDEAIVEGLMQLMHVFWSCVMMKTAVTNMLYTFVVKFGPCTRFYYPSFRTHRHSLLCPKIRDKIFLSQHVCKIKTRTFCYFMKNPFITVSLSFTIPQDRPPHAAISRRKAL